MRVVEGSRERVQVFQGVVIGRQHGGVRETFTVRKISFGVGVERTFPLHSPRVKGIEVRARGKTRRARLYYLRDRIGKAVRLPANFGRGKGPSSQRGMPESSQAPSATAEASEPQASE